MSTPIFPISLPTVNQLSLQSQSNVISDEGVVKNFRRNSRVPNATDKVQWTFVNDELNVFLTFYKITLLDGHKWFYIKLPSAKGIVYHIARFLSLQTNVIGHKAWTVDAQLELRERAFEVIEPIVDPEPPTGEPDVLTLYFRNGSGNFGGGFLSGSSFADEDRIITAADYASYDSGTGVVTITQLGVYEVNFSVGMGSGDFGSSRTEVGTFLGSYTNFAHTKSSALYRHQILDDDPSDPLFMFSTDFVDSHVIMVTGDLPASFIPQLFATRYSGGGSYSADMTVVIRRLGDYVAP